jgi:hypothetical protein
MFFQTQTFKENSSATKTREKEMISASFLSKTPF